MPEYIYESSVYSVKENGTKHYVYIPLKDALTTASSKIPPYSSVYVELIIYADTSTASNDAYLRASLTNSNGSTTYLSEFAEGSVDGNGSSITNYSEIRYIASDWFHSGNASAGDIKGYGGDNTYIQCYFNLFVLTNYTFAAKIAMRFSWTEPSAVVTVTSNLGDDYVSGGGRYYYGSSYTITAKDVEGYTFVRWSDGNTSKSRTFAVDDAFVSTHKAWLTYLDYEAIYEVAKINKIYIGTSQPKKIYIGTQEVKAVYIGTTKVYG